MASSTDDQRRSSGLLLHPTALPGGHGIGDLGPAARAFVETLAQAGQGLWQMLPSTPPEPRSNSPYSSLSAVAGNPLLISLDDLVAEGLADAALLAGLPRGDGDRVDFPRVQAAKGAALAKVAAGILAEPDASPLRCALSEFCHRHGAAWLDDYALFMALRRHHRDKPWTAWDRRYRTREPAALASAAKIHARAMDEVRVQQFLFDRQWRRLRAHAAAHGVRIIGDMPMFVAQDSADVWARRGLFRVNLSGSLPVVAGAPGDKLERGGQKWNAPLYDWAAHEAEGFAWWKQRVGRLLELVDLIRVDHFRGFAACWEIPADGTPSQGRWVPTPGAALFAALAAEFGELPMLAEDFGVITADVIALRDNLGFPGLRICLFEFARMAKGEPATPRPDDGRQVACTGTHDFDTVRGWLDGQGGSGAESVRTLMAALGCDDYDSLHRAMVRHVLDSNAALAVLPVQDWLGLGSDARFNIPGRATGCWDWRLTPGQIGPDDIAWLRQATAAAGRTAALPEPA